MEHIISQFLEKGRILSEDGINFLRENPELNEKVQQILEIEKIIITKEDLARFLEKKGEKMAFEVKEELLKVPQEMKGLEKLENGNENSIIVIRRTEPLLSKDIGTDLKILYESKVVGRDKKVDDFVSYFRSRYTFLKKILNPRLENLASIGRLSQGEKVSIIGMVTETVTMKNNHKFFTIEDFSGSIRVLIRNNSPLYAKSETIVNDEVIAIRGTVGDKIVFAEDIIEPEIPLLDEPEEKDDVNVVMMSDLHVGSKEFLEPAFLRFVDWLKLKSGNQSQRDEASKVKYIFIAGDIVDGIGIYQEQKKDLKIPDLCKQYEKTAELLSLIPDHIKLIISPGNHDAQRLPEPQPGFIKEFAEPLWSLPNAILTSNPSLIEVHKTKILEYHGMSLISVADAIPSLKHAMTEAPEKLVVELLKKRHLYPIYGAGTRGVICPELIDDMVIKDVPNVLHTGHLHSLGFTNYRGVWAVNSGCFQGITEYQIRLGHLPNPAKIPILNLKSNKIMLMDFNQ